MFYALATLLFSWLENGVPAGEDQAWAGCEEAFRTARAWADKLRPKTAEQA